MGFTVEDSSGDVYVGASAPTPGEALAEIARGFTAVVTGGGPVEAAFRLEVDVAAKDHAALLVAFINELVFLFDSERFLPAGGDLTLQEEGGRPSITGTLAGQEYDPERHGRGVEVKAATYHRLRFDQADGRVDLRVLLDL